MTRDNDKPESPWGLIWVGGLIGLLGGFGLASLDSDAGALVTTAAFGATWFGGILAGVGVVGAGVTMGMQRADWIIRRGGR